ncbi:von Willebrand factor type A [Parafrankia sp. EAN1pec]|uniref:vWA domain-containing protein n=1 Tax=Parafrankia sp. (strain EAN1pec) TaxID=298653 RepID=UPI0000543C03|nr:von Willebrand factor type A [Frankia sp. EAN1pec]
MEPLRKNTDDDLLVLAFYILVDASYSMSGAPMLAVNEILPEVISTIEQSPTLGDVVRLGALDFADDARVVLRLDDLRNIGGVPQFAARGGTSYAAGFRQLRKEIESDLAQLKGDGYKVYRPAVFFITDGEPTDDQKDLDAAFAELTDANFRGRPNIIPFGVVSSVNKQTLDPWVYPKPADRGKPMRSYVYSGQGDAATAIRQIAEILISSIVASVNSVNDSGTAGGFVPPDDDLDDWI